jgi:hypothetical protein
VRLPTFLIIGSPKCGTTALAQLLSSHADVFLSQPKEPHHFDAGYDRDLAAYLRDHYGGWKNERAAGEATPSYLYVPYVAARIRESLPDARLIAILRNPVDRAYSSWWMLNARGMEPLSFEDAIAENEQQLSDRSAMSDAEFEAAWRIHVRVLRAGGRIELRNYLDGGYYARHLRRYLDCFPREQLEVVLSDDLRDEPEKVLRRLWRFVGVADDAAVPHARAVNEAVGPGARSLLRVAQATGLMRLRRYLPERGRAWIKGFFSSLGEPPRLDPATRARLVEHFAGHINDLEQLLGRSLDAWRR